MKKVAVMLLVSSLLFTLAACQGNLGDTENVAPTKPVIEKDEPTSVMNEAQKPDVEDLDSQVSKAKVDLSVRLGVALDEIKLIQASKVTWPDGSLGCPQKGMSYTQALVPGVLIILSAGNSKYNYHSGRGGDPRYCATPRLPISKNINLNAMR